MEGIALDKTPLALRLEEVMSLPVPAKEGFWSLHCSSKPTLVRKKFLEVFKKEISAEEIRDLRKRALQAPGRTLSHIQKHLKGFPEHSELLMLSAICTYGINVNSADNQGMFSALKLATRDAAAAIVYDGLSLFNAQNFIRLYELTLDRYKRKLDHLQREFLGQGQSAQRSAINHAESVIWALDEERKLVKAAIMHLRRLTYAQSVAFHFSFECLSNVVAALQAGRKKEAFGPYSASEILSIVCGLAMAFARVPILHPLIDALLEAIPSMSEDISLRKTSIFSIQQFVLIRLAGIDGATDLIRKTCQMVYQANLELLPLVEKRAIKHRFEADIFLNLAQATLKAVEHLTPDELVVRVGVSKKALAILVAHDKTEATRFAQQAQPKIRQLMEIELPVGQDKT